MYAEDCMPAGKALATSGSGSRHLPASPAGCLHSGAPKRYQRVSAAVDILSDLVPDKEFIMAKTNTNFTIQCSALWSTVEQMQLAPVQGAQ